MTCQNCTQNSLSSSDIITNSSWVDSFRSFITSPHMLLDMNYPVVQGPMTTVNALSVVVNGLLLCLIIFRSQQVLGTYKVLLFMYTFTAFCSSTALILTLPVLLQSTNGVIFFNTVERLPHGGAIIALIVFSVSYILWGLILALSFLYRCLTVRNKEHLIFNRKGWALIIASMVSVSIFFVFICFYYSPQEEILDLMAERTYNVTGKDIYDLAVLGGEFFKPDGSLGNGFYHCTFHIGFIMICLIAMICCTVYFYYWLAESSTERYSEATKHHQKRLFHLLLLQTIAPLLFSFLPALIMASLSSFGIELPGNANYLLSFIITLPQLLDSLFILAFIRDYRETLVCHQENRSAREMMYAMKEIMPSTRTPRN